MRISAALVAMLAVAVLAACSASEGSGGVSPPKHGGAVGAHRHPTPGCDRPQPERGWEALALVRVTETDGDPVAPRGCRGAVTGCIGGPAVAVSFREPGACTTAIGSVTGARAIPATRDSSKLSETLAVGEHCATA